MRPLSINEITNLSEKLVANENMSSELGELLIFTYKYMIQAVKDRDDIIKHLKAGTPKTKEFKKMNNKLLKKIEKLESDIALIEKEKVELLNENNRLQNNNGELIIELKNIHNMSKNAIAKHSAITESADAKQDADMVEDEESQDAAIIIRGISTRLYNAILRYMLNNNMLDKYEDRERKLEEFIIKHESIQSLHISSIGKQSIEEYNSIRRRLMKAIVGE